MKYFHQYSIEFDFRYTHKPESPDLMYHGNIHMIHIVLQHHLNNQNWTKKFLEHFPNLRQIRYVYTIENITPNKGEKTQKTENLAKILY